MLWLNQAVRSKLFKYKLRRKIDIDPDTNMPIYGDEEIVLGFNWGQLVQYQDDAELEYFNNNTYVLLDKVSRGDLLEGQVVKNVYIAQGFKPNDIIYKVSTHELSQSDD